MPAYSKIELSYIDAYGTILHSVELTVVPEASNLAIKLVDVWGNQHDLYYLILCRPVTTWNIISKDDETGEEVTVWTHKTAEARYKAAKSFVIGKKDLH